MKSSRSWLTWSVWVMKMPFVLGACSHAPSRVVRIWHCRTRTMGSGPKIVMWSR